MSEVRQAAEEYFITTLPHMVETKEDREYWFRPGNSKTIDAFIAGSEYLTSQIEALKKENEELKMELELSKPIYSRRELEKNYAGLIAFSGKQAIQLNEAIKALEIFNLQKRFLIEDVGFWANEGFCINCGDTFAYACSDAEEIPDGELPLVANLYDQFGYDGVVAWIANNRGCDPIKPCITEKYKLARETLTKLRGDV